MNRCGFGRVGVSGVDQTSQDTLPGSDALCIVGLPVEIRTGFSLKNIDMQGISLRVQGGQCVHAEVTGQWHFPWANSNICLGGILGLSPIGVRVGLVGGGELRKDVWYHFEGDFMLRTLSW